MKTIRLILYEIFGYAFPGVVCMGGIILIVWRIIPSDYMNLNNVSAGGWWLCLGIAYTLGHSLQAISNIVFRCSKTSPQSRFLSDIKDVPKEVRIHLEQKIEQSTGLNHVSSLASDVLFHIADTTIQQHGETEMRDVYIYQEGYYRGMTLGLLVFAIGLLVQLGRQAHIEVFGISTELFPQILWPMTILAVISSILHYYRYIRLIRYRMTFVIYSYLTGKNL